MKRNSYLWKRSGKGNHFEVALSVQTPCLTPDPYNIADLTQLRFPIPFSLSENLFELSNFPHSLNFTHPILALAVTATLQPLLAFTLSPKEQKPLTVSTSSHNSSFHTQNLSPTSGSPSLLSCIFHGSICCISHTTLLNLLLLAFHNYHMDLHQCLTMKA